MKATEQYFPVALFIVLHHVILTFESVDEILKCDYSNESLWAVFSCRNVCYFVQVDSNFAVCGKSNVWQWARLEAFFNSINATLLGKWDTGTRRS